jgi:hypothetical protein
VASRILENKAEEPGIVEVKPKDLEEPSGGTHTQKKQGGYQCGCTMYSFNQARMRRAVMRNRAK